MGTQTQGSNQGGVYKWEVPGQPVAIHIELDVVDRMLRDVMQGFGAVPKRGAEVGGILLGAVEQGERPVVRIEDYEVVPCEYRRGPSYLLSETDRQAFDDVSSRWSRTEESTLYRVGYFRSHTREGFGLGAEDLELCSQYFAEPSNVVLVIRPYATRVSVAGFLCYEDGKLQESSQAEFPFRRRELEGGPAPAARPLSAARTAGEPRLPATRETGLEPLQTSFELEDPEPGQEYARLTARSWENPEARPGAYEDAAMLVPEPQPADAVTTLSKPRFRSGWVWIPLSFIFLLLGVLLGFQAALTINSRGAAAAQRNLGLSLTVSKADDNLNVTWDRDSAAVRNAQRGVLNIQDGLYQKAVDLDAGQLQTGSIIFHNATNRVRFRLEVYLRGDVTMAQTLEWQGP